MTERLLGFLRGRANRRGLVVVSGDILFDRLGASHAEIEDALRTLTSEGAIEVVTPLPFLVVKLRSWSGSGAKPAYSRPVVDSYSKLSNNQSIESYSHASNAALLGEILETLGETDPTSFAGAIRNFPADVIRQALDRVRRTKSLRKNRTALFRYLLAKHS